MLVGYCVTRGNAIGAGRVWAAFSRRDTRRADTAGKPAVPPSPKLLRGSWFAIAEGIGPLKLFWHKGGNYYARNLTWEQTSRVCDATGLPREYGYS
jgi:hypothetical protein